ncbi:MAG: L,D-transpeptidase [Akkermansiaceae bacterium]
MKVILAITAPVISLTALLFSSCASTTPASSGAAYLADYKTYTGQPGQIAQPASAAPTEVGYWDGDGVAGEAMIKINIGEQQAYFYKGNQLVGQTPISTGIEGRITPKGSYKVTEKDIDHTSSLYGVIKDNATGAIVNDDADTRKHRAKAGQTFVHAPMYNFLRYNGAIGMHTGHLPGYAASHGCVRLPDNMAKHFYNNAKLGTPVIVE